MEGHMVERRARDGERAGDMRYIWHSTGVGYKLGTSFGISMVDLHLAYYTNI